MEAMGLESIKGRSMMCVSTCKSASDCKTMALRTKFLCPFNNNTMRIHARKSRACSVRSCCYTAWEDKYRTLRLQAMEYLKQKGYGQLSLKQAKDQQNSLGIFNAQDHLSRDDEAYTSFPGVAPSKGSYIKYLRERGFGLASLDEVRVQQARLGIFGSDLVSHDDLASRSRLEGEQGLHLNKAFGEDITDRAFGEDVME